jgi:hypothetical protein
VRLSRWANVVRDNTGIGSVDSSYLNCRRGNMRTHYGKIFGSFGERSVALLTTGAPRPTHRRRYRIQNLMAKKCRRYRHMYTTRGQ